MSSESVKTESVSAVATASEGGPARQPPNDRGFFGHPAGLLTLFFAEMWERFSYYGMRALLILFLSANTLNGGLQYSKDYAGRIYALYTSFVYLSGMVGGWLADNVLGQRRAVLYGGIIIMFGHICLALHGEGYFMIGLVLIIMGTGLLKPNISTIVGQLYKEGDERRDAGFSIYYMGINLGSFCGQWVCGTLAQAEWFRALLKKWGTDPESAWHYGFGAAAVGMFFGVVVFLWKWKLMGDAGLHPLPPANADEAARRQRTLIIGSVVFALLMAGIAGVYHNSNQPNRMPDEEYVAKELGIRVKPTEAKDAVVVTELAGGGAISKANLFPAKPQPVRKPNRADLVAPVEESKASDEPKGEGVPWKVGDRIVSFTFKIPYRDRREADPEKQQKVESKRYEVASVAGIADVLRNEAWKKGHSLEAYVQRDGANLAAKLDCQTALLPLLNAGFGVLLTVVIVGCFFWLLVGGGWEKQERDRLTVVVILFFASALFWAAFEQAGGSLNIFAEAKTRCEIFGSSFPSTYFQNVNPFGIFVMAPFFAWFWIRLGARQPSSPVKFAIGMFLVGAGFVVAYFAALANETTQQLVGPYWLVVVYILHTAGELCLSPVGLSMVTKLAPARAVSRVMSIWFLSNALANWLAGQAVVLEKNYSTSAIFGGTAVITIFFGFILLALTPYIKRLMGGVR